MKLDISEKRIVTPLGVDGGEVFRLLEVVETERVSKQNKGKFKQYQILCQDQNNEECEINFLMGNQLRPLLTQWGIETDNWKGQFFKANTTSSNKDGKLYHNFQLETVGNPEWATKKVDL